MAFLPCAAFCQGSCHNRKVTKILLVHLLALWKTPGRNKLTLQRWLWFRVSETSVSDHLPQVLSGQGWDVPSWQGQSHRILIQYWWPGIREEKEIKKPGFVYAIQGRAHLRWLNFLLTDQSLPPKDLTISQQCQELGTKLSMCELREEPLQTLSKTAVTKSVIKTLSQ